MLGVSLTRPYLRPLTVIIKGKKLLREELTLLSNNTNAVPARGCNVKNAYSIKEDSMNTELDSTITKSPSKIAIQLISRYKDEAEEIVYRVDISPRAKEALLVAIKNRRIQLANLRGY